MAKRKHVFQIIVEQDEAGYYVAECPALRACYTQGKTYALALLQLMIDEPDDVAAMRREVPHERTGTV